MARAPRPWFRWYVEAIHDRKLRRACPATRWLWVTVCTVARTSPVAGYLLVSERSPVSIADLVDLAALTKREVEKGMAYFESEGMIEMDDMIGAFLVPAFLTRQFESDNVTERTRKHRSKEH